MVGIFLALPVPSVLMQNFIKTYVLPYIMFGINTGSCLLKM